MTGLLRAPLPHACHASKPRADAGGGSAGLVGRVAQPQPRLKRVVGFFLEREAAEMMIREVGEDELALAEELPVEATELG